MPSSLQFLRLLALLAPMSLAASLPAQDMPTAIGTPPPTPTPAAAPAATPAPAAAEPAAQPAAAQPAASAPGAERPAGTATIQPGTVWLDDRGKPIQAHGGGIVKFGDTWYWYGEDRSPDNDREKRVVACYSSTDLLHWKFRNKVINQVGPPDIGPRWVLERPKVYYNARTRKFVMYMHSDGPHSPTETDPKRSSYALAKVGVAVCDTPDGNFKYLRSFRPLNQESRDIGQFIDDDGSAYLIFESRPTHGFFIAKLSDDYLDVKEQTAFVKAPLEGGTLVHYKGMYYVVASYMSGWDPNDNVYATAPSIRGPWTEFKGIAPKGKRTYNSQSTMLLRVDGSKTTSVLFMGDKWNKNNLPDSRYLWMPVEIGGGNLQLPEPKEWTLNARTGEVFTSPPFPAPADPGPSRSEPGAATPAATPPPSAAAATPFPRFASVADAQKEAVRRYPDLAVNGSRFNAAFVARYQQQRPEALRDPAWPLRLAEEVARGLAAAP